MREKGRKGEKEEEEEEKPESNIEKYPLVDDILIDIYEF